MGQLFPNLRDRSADRMPVNPALANSTTSSQNLTSAKQDSALLLVEINSRDGNLAGVLSQFRRLGINTRGIVTDPSLAKVLISQALRGATAPASTENPAATLDPQTGQNAIKPLSEREREIFQLLAEGMQNATIARKLFISPRTVETHRARIVRKLGLKTNGDIIRFAIRNGLTVV